MDVKVKRKNKKQKKVVPIKGMTSDEIVKKNLGSAVREIFLEEHGEEDE